MFELIKSIKIKGGPFTTETCLELFPKRLNLLFGRNGSGKSTIAKCISNIGKEDSYSAETSGSLDSEALNNIFVFDENFISSNFRIEQDGLKSIVMLGQQVGLDEKLQDLLGIQKRLSSQKEKLEKNESLFENPKRQESPYWYFNAIKRQLADKDGWADRDKQIKGNSIKSSVTVDLINELMDMRITPSMYLKLRKEYDEKYEIFQKVKKGGNTLALFSDNVISEGIENLRTLYEKKLEEPKLSSRDKKIIELVRSDHGEYMERIHLIFDNVNMTVCPLCLRPISSSEKNNLFDKIELFFNEESDKYKQQLQSLIDVLAQWKPREITDIVKEIIGDDVATQYFRNGIELQTAYLKLKKAFEERKLNVYGYHSYKGWYDLRDAQEKYSITLSKVNSAITYYNMEVEQKDRLKKELLVLNKRIASFRLRRYFDAYRRQLGERNKNSQLLSDTERQLLNNKIHIADIHSQKAQVTIALDFINESLSYIFFDKKRLVLENYLGTYVLKSCGRNVRPKDVSTGERNAIALCYFFATAFENHEKKNCYTDEKLFVLDDPITSFDKENKVGMMSFLRWQISELFKGNSHTKILVMTHDLMTAFNFQKVYKDIDENQYSVLELKNRTLDNLKTFRYKRNEYKKLIEDVFAVANSTSSDLLSIGNKMRRIEEAYSSFICNGGFEKMLHSDEFLQKVPASKKTFYKNFMSRLILNTESHTEESVYDMANFSQMFDEDEIRKTAKYLLMLFYYVNSFHLKSYLGEEFSVVEKWINEEEV